MGSIPYTLGFVASGLGKGNGTPIALLTNASQILMSDYQNAARGAYINGQLVTLTINCPTCTAPRTIFATIPVGNVTGTIADTCAFPPGSSTLTFNMDPSVSGTTTAPILPDLKIKCTKNLPFTVVTLSACGAGSPKMGLGGCAGFKIPYTFTGIPNATGNGFGVGMDISLGISGSANSVDYANAPQGSYSDIETITINY
jgi:hypothetical protein